VTPVPWAPDYVTADQLSDYCRTIDVDDEGLDPMARTAASRAIDQRTNRQFGKVDSPVARIYRPWPDYDRGVWCVTIDDLMDTDGLVVDLDGTTVTQFELEPLNAAADGRPWETLVFTDDSEARPTKHTDKVTMTAPWGWDAFPPAVVEATLLQASRLKKRRDAPFGIAGSPDMGSEVRLLARLDPDVVVILGGYGRARGMG
jgi:hypothetical protein